MVAVGYVTAKLGMFILNKPVSSLIFTLFFRSWMLLGLVAGFEYVGTRIILRIAPKRLPCRNLRRRIKIEKVSFCAGIPALLCRSTVNYLLRWFCRLFEMECT